MPDRILSINISILFYNQRLSCDIDYVILCTDGTIYFYLKVFEFDNFNCGLLTIICLTTMISKTIIP